MIDFIKIWVSLGFGNFLITSLCELNRKGKLDIDIEYLKYFIISLLLGALGMIMMIDYVIGRNIRIMRIKKFWGKK